jgi:two-component system cell cycle sensor histidine kinase/response regulator CckA
MRPDRLPDEDGSFRQTVPMSESLHLFLIEDDDDIALLIRKGLERVNHRITRCRTAADALIVLGQTRFDLVLLDQQLPDMPGLDLLQELTREGIPVPVLMVTAHGDEDLAARVLRSGALDYVVKDQALTFLNELPKRVVESVTRHRLTQMNNLLVQALESARDGIMITDLHGTILSVNRALLDQTGYSRPELLGANPRILQSGLHTTEFYAEMWRTILNRTSWQGEITNRRKDGTLYEASETISPILDEQGRLTHFVGIARDITEHKRLQRQLLQAQKMQSVGNLAGGVAHEFNNLLAGINGYASLGLREPGLNPTVREFLEQVVTLSERAAVLTRQLLAFARKPALSRQRTRIAELVQATADLVRRTLHVEVELEVEAGEDAAEALEVDADANQLQQALVNLALNARDALRDREAKESGAPAEPEGSNGLFGSGLMLKAPRWPVLFRVRSEVLTQERVGFPQKVPPGAYVVLQVEDQGCGMSPEVLSQSLDPFFTTKEIGQGTGLGLPMVFGIVQGHHGYLTIDSLPGQGTCVTLYLPRLVEPAGTLVPAPAAAEDAGTHALPARTILVIDDEQAVLDVVRRYLAIAGHRVLAATSGYEGLELLREQPVHLVILDLMMPREEATTTLQRLRQRAPGVPVLLCTGLPQSEPVPELLRQGAAGLLRKPFRMNELWAAVKQALQGGEW